jgi:DNA-binding response OmpR family regulator
MVNRSDDSPVLIAQTGALQGQRWLLSETDFIIGRDDDVDLVIAERQVSRNHAIIRFQQGTYIIQDLESKNGTYVNGVQIKEPVSLQDGDSIQIALACEVIFVGTEATLPLSKADAAQLGLGRLRMDPQAHRVWVGEQEIDPPLSPPQYRMLELLYDNPDRVVTRDEIAACVWPGTEGVGVSDQAIDALVRRLRDRLAEVDPNHAYVVTVRGHGFRLENPV